MPARRVPTEIKKAKGTLRQSREPEQEPEFPVEPFYPAPEHLDGLALITWQNFEPMLREARVLKSSDLVALEQYCVAYQTFVQAGQEVRLYGLVVKDDRGSKKNPAISAQAEASRELRALSALLGLDPSSRGKIEVGKPEHEKAKGFGQLAAVRRA